MSVYRTIGPLVFLFILCIKIIKMCNEIDSVKYPKLYGNLDKIIIQEEKRLQEIRYMC